MHNREYSPPPLSVFQPEAVWVHGPVCGGKRGTTELDRIKE